MIILSGSKIGKSTISSDIGKPEYSYYFLFQAFKTAIEQVGTLIEISAVEKVDALYHRYTAKGEKVIFLCFSPPYQIPTDLECPTVCVFAWEFETIPTMTWTEDPRHNWRFVFDSIDGIIATSSYAADQVKGVSNDTEKVEALPSSTWDSFSHIFKENGWLPYHADRHIPFKGYIVDSQAIQFNADGLVSPPTEAAVEHDTVEPINFRQFLGRTVGMWKAYRADMAKVTDHSTTKHARKKKPTEAPQFHNLLINGVVFTTVLNPADGRKNWIDIITAFCWAFKNIADATLVVKMTHYDMDFYRLSLMTLLSRLSPFKCRVIVLHTFLKKVQYDALIKASTFYVNASSCEGLCLPLMEFLSAGKPAISPNHTAMHDYVTSENSIVLKYAREPTCWPHDPAGMIMTYRYRINWESLMHAYKYSYDLAKHDPDKYKAMSSQAHGDMRSYCSVETVSNRLRMFLNSVLNVQEEATL